MKTWIVLATCLCCNIAIASCYTTVTFTTDDASVGSYQTFISSLRTNLDSKSESHGIPLLKKSSEITKQNMFLLVELINYDSKLSITVALTVINVYVIGYKSGDKSFLLKDAPDEAHTNILFGTTEKKNLTVDSNCNSLGDRSKVGLGIGPLKKSIDRLNKFDGKSENTEFKESLLIVIQMIAEATRFKFIELQIENHLLDEYKPKPDTTSYENSWDKLSEQIQLSGSDGVFKTPIQVQNADGSPRSVSNVAQIKPDISILLYKGPKETRAEAISDEEDVVEEWLP